VPTESHVSRKTVPYAYNAHVPIVANGCSASTSTLDTDIPGKNFNFIFFKSMMLHASKSHSKEDEKGLIRTTYA